MRCEHPEIGRTLTQRAPIGQVRHADLAELLGARLCRLGRRTGLKGISGSAALALEMPQNAIHNPWLGYYGDNLHLGATGTEHGVDFENLAEQASPPAAGFPGELGILVIC